jgi:hypothetical protein
MLIEFDDGSTFAQGAAGYNTVPGYEMSEHIVLMVEIGASAAMKEAAIDSSSPYLIFSSDVAKSIGLNLSKPDATGRARIQGQMIEGSIFVVPLTLLADPGEGVSLQQDVWAFVPHPDKKFDPDPLPPTLIGFKRCLDSFFFAVDPFKQTFYFG